MAVSHGTRSCYNGGCRCNPCVKAERDYGKTRKRVLGSTGKVVTALPAVSVGDSGPGAVEAGVLAEIDGLSTVDSRQGLVQVALALARVLDSPLAIAQHPSAAHRLSETLDKIRKGADSRVSRLAAVRQMTRRSEATG